MSRRRGYPGDLLPRPTFVGIDQRPGMPKTASTQVSNILRKTDASNRVEAATLAHRIGIVD